MLKLSSYFFLFAVLNFFQQGVYSQTRSLDSLKRVLKTTKDDTNKINILKAIGWKLRYDNPDTSIIVTTQALKLSEKLYASPDKALAKWGEKNMAVSSTNLGFFNTVLGNYTQALQHYLKSLTINERINDRSETAGTLCNIGIVYYSQGDYPKALAYYFKALKIDEEIGNKKWTANVLGNIGIIYDEQGDYSKALEYFFKSLKLAEELNDKNGIAHHLCEIGINYCQQKNYSKALDYCFRGAKIAEEQGDNTLLGANLSNIGIAYKELADSAAGKRAIIASDSLYKKAFAYFFKGLKIDEELGDKNGIAIKLGNLGSLYVTFKKYKQGEDYLLRALALCDSIGSLNNTLEFENVLSNLYSQTGRPKLALEHYKKFIAAKDSLTNEENTKKTVRLEMNYEFDKKESSAKLEQEKKEAVATAESKKQKIIIWSVCGILLLVFAFALFAYRSFLQKKKINIEITKQKHLIEEKQREILDSIHYAKRIQTALITNDNYIDKNLRRLMKRLPSC